MEDPMPNTPSTYWRLQKGRHFETTAQRFLERQGLQLIERNYRCLLGEIDLVMLDRAALVFVEVRYRRNAQYGPALATVDVHKQHKIRNAARHFLHCRKQYQHCICRFDVLGIEAGTSGEPRIHWVPHAFY
jgi:putative endonuclease